MDISDRKDLQIGKSLPEILYLESIFNKLLSKNLEIFRVITTLIKLLSRAPEI